MDSCLKPIKDIQNSTRRIVVRVQMRVVLIRAVLRQPADSQSRQSRISWDIIISLQHHITLLVRTPDSIGDRRVFILVRHFEGGFKVSATFVEVELALAFFSFG